MIDDDDDADDDEEVDDVRSNEITLSSSCFIVDHSALLGFHLFDLGMRYSRVVRK